MAIIKTLQLCPNFRYHTVEENIFGEKDLENVILLIKKSSVMNDFGCILYGLLVRFISK